MSEETTVKDEGPADELPRAQHEMLARLDELVDRYRAEASEMLGAGHDDDARYYHGLTEGLRIARRTVVRPWLRDHPQAPEVSGRTVVASCHTGGGTVSAETAVERNSMGPGGRLRKWPGILVTGDKVTEDQAAEIIVRTNMRYIGTNDREWEATVRDILGLPTERSGDWEAEQAAFNRLRVLDLAYLVNSRIASAYIGGPYGWCAWDGTIGCSGFNIGKWPTVELVAGEWERIAAAFPFLSLRCQLLSGESCEADSVPVVEFVVDAGGVSVVEPGPVIEADPAGSLEVDVLEVFMPGGERGCTVDQLRHAVAIVTKEEEQ